MAVPRELEIDENIPVGIPPQSFRELLRLSELLKGELTWQREAHCPRYVFRGGKAFVWTIMTLDEIREENRAFREKLAQGKSIEEIREWLSERGKAK